MGGANPQISESIPGVASSAPPGGCLVPPWGHNSFTPSLHNGDTIWPFAMQLGNAHRLVMWDVDPDYCNSSRFCLWIHILTASLSWSYTALFIMLSMCETLCPGLLSDSFPYSLSLSGSGCEHDDRQPRRYSQLRHYCDCSQTTPSVRHHVRDTVSLFWVPHGTYRCQPTSHHYAQESEACDCVSCCWCDT